MYNNTNLLYKYKYLTQILYNTMGLKREKNICREYSVTRHWVMMFLLAMVTLLSAIPQVARADYGEFDTPERAFSWYSKGMGCMHVTIKLCNNSPRRTFHSGKFYLTDKKTGEKITCFDIGETKSSNSGYSEMNMSNPLASESHMFLTNVRNKNGQKIYVTSDSKSYEISGLLSSTYSDCYAEFDWYYPVRFAGRSFDVSVEGAQIWIGETSKYEAYAKEKFATIEFDKINLETYDVIPGTEAENAGVLRMPISCDRVINYANTSIKTANGWRDIGRTTFDSNAYSSFINLPSHEAIDGVRVEVNVTSASWTDATGSDPKELKGNITIEGGAVPSIHGPRLLWAEMIDDRKDVVHAGSVKLTWQIADVGKEDMLEGDMFQVQRSLTGRIEDYEDITLVQFDKDSANYEYLDTTLIESLDTSLIDKELGIPLVRYRVYRASTAQLWGMEHNPTVAYVMPHMPTLDLLKIKDFDADWANEEEHQLRVTWDYTPGNGTDHIRVYDGRAKVKILYKMLNRANKEIGTGEYVLTKEELAKKEVVIPLSRSCVNYELSMEMFPGTSPIGKGTGDNIMQIWGRGDWESFVRRVNAGKTKLNAMLMKDIMLNNSSEIIGYDSDIAYQGIFNGNGHTIELVFDENASALSPFYKLANGAVVCNLKVDGSITSKSRYAAGISSHITQGVVSLEQNTNYAKIAQASNAWFADTSTGGLVGIVENTATLHIYNSLVNGIFYNSYINNSGYGGFVGLNDNSAFTLVSNSYFNPNKISYLEGFWNTHTFVHYDNNACAISPAILDCGYSVEFGTLQGKKFTSAPKNAAWDYSTPKVTTYSFTTPTIGFKLSLDPQKAKLKNWFYYENSGKVLKDSLSTETHQSSVSLKWESDGGAIDSYEVYRRKTDDGAKWEMIASNITQMEYEDKTVKPVFSYYYKVASLVSCEGEKRVYTDSVLGNCVQTGMVEGYVRFADGSGIANRSISISQYGDGASSEVWHATTDEAGYFKVEGLPYWKGQTGPYLIMTDVNSADLSEDCKTGLHVTFNSETNLYRNRTFIVTSGVKFSGSVLYRGTSIPVQGVKFLVDSIEVRSASGPVTSDFEGHFSFIMLGGKHTIRAVKDGHDFWQDGYYVNEKGETDVEFAIDKSSVYFYDVTKVKLIGRIAGGKEQGDIPLGNSLSRNNLGKDLKMVLTLEGDNASWLVFENTNKALTERDTIYIHEKHGKNDNTVYQTKVHTNRHRMEVTPDVNTGEYELLLPPVKWKIQQITARGYATLFQDGKTSEVIDLTDSLTNHTDTYYGAWATATGDTVREVDVKYHAQYSRIYRAPIQLEYKQIGYDKFDYFGDRIYTAQSLVGDKVKVPLVYQALKEEYKALKDKSKWIGKDSTVVKYTFGAPVFNIDRQYPFQLKAVERYYFNNNQQSDTVDIVSAGRALVTIRNRMVDGTHKDTLSLDENGEGYYILTAAQRPYSLTGKDALYTVTFSMEKDGVAYEAAPLKAYTLNQYKKAGAKDYMSITAPILIDVLRDPPGSGSTAKLSKGSTLKQTYQMDMSWKAGLTIGIATGSKLANYAGIGSLGPHVGLVNNAGSKLNTSIDIMFSGSGQRAFSYTMTATEDITTDAGVTMVGADADVYMGVVTNTIATPTVSIRAIPDSTFIHMTGELLAGRMVEIATGYGEKGDTFHLVRDETISFMQELKSNFVHSQTHIVSQMIPDLANQSMSLMYVGSEEEATTLANSTGKRVYLSLRDKDDERFGVMNTDSVTGEYIYNSTRNRYSDQSKMNYLIVVPNTEDNKITTDEVYNYTQLIAAWASMIQRNEQQKLEATDLVQRFDIDGGAGLSYGEEFSSDYSNSNIYVNPISSFTHDYFDWANVNDKESSSTGKYVTTGIVSIIGSAAAKLIAPLLKAGTTSITGSKTSSKGKTADGLPLLVTELSFGGSLFKIELTPALAFSMTPKQTLSTKYSRKESFNIKMDKKSHLLVDVYRVKTIDSAEDPEVTVQRKNDRDVFMETNFMRNVDYVKHFLDRGVGLYDKGEFVYPRSFVYRTRGGATVRTWENERKTLFYNAGTVLDERTKKIENPIIRMDKQSISGVPYGEPARFKLYMTNESEEPDAIGGALRYFTLFADSKSNPNGAKMFVDGLPLTADGTTVMAVPGEVTTKTLEVYAGDSFDYDNLKLGLISQGDVQCVDNVAFSVHYLRTAGSVTISNPGNKWIMNTDAPYDSIRGWYMPVIISGFDRNQKNFDHIEFQYKETTRGDDYWTNLCSFYSDSTLYRQASGTREMMPQNGYINTKFYGEGQVMEKAYDLRAVLFCRNGNSYLTNASAVLTGIKDTRKPQLFGAPEPKDGILGIGDNVIFNFSEPIEHNYLREETNFEVMGETNETVLQEEPSLQFDGLGYVETDARRNFADKNVAVDMMIRPDITNKQMPLFSHGTDGNRLQLWVTENLRLKAVVDDKEYYSTSAIEDNSLQHVALMINHNDHTLSLYNDSIIGQFADVKYNGFGPLIFGATNENDVDARSHYKGRMLEVRVWNRAMTESLMRIYAKHKLTGYEMGLIDYYPMNEGEGKYASDIAQGAHAQLHGASWALPRGMSLRLDWAEEKTVKGMKLQRDRMSRSAEDDYTLMFWFKTNNNGKGALISNGSGRRTDDDAENRFYIGFEGEQLIYRSNGMQLDLGKSLADDEWHHYAMTVSRAHKVANIYVDRVLTASVPADTLGGMDSDDFYVGNMVWHEAGTNIDVLHQANALTGNIDEICLFSQALPHTLIKRFSKKSPSGKEKGLLTYMAFSRQERQENNEYVQVPYVNNQAIELDKYGNVVKKNDTVFVEPVAYIMQHIDKNLGAPVQANIELKNLNFSFVGRDNQLLVNIDELDSRINKRSLYVTVTDIPDLNGNYMSSPYTGVFYVDRNPLRWDKRILKETIHDTEEYYFSARIVNNSGASHRYTIENLPNWITIDHQENIIDGKEEQEVYFVVTSDLNVGTYDETIYLTDENGLSEPLMLNITKQGVIPDNWGPTDDMKRYSMSLVGRVKIGDEIVTDTGDRIGAFDSNGRAMGLAEINYNESTGVSLVFLTVFDSIVSEKPLNFKLWHSRTGKVMVLQPNQSVKFVPGKIVGSVSDPIIFSTTSQFVQTINLDYGWNWISMNLYNDDLRNIIDVLNKYKWSNGDIFVSDRDNLTLVYNSYARQWIKNMTTEQVDKVKMLPSNGYRIYRHTGTTIEIVGDKLEQINMRTIPVRKGWNSIGYTPMINLPVSTALTDYSTMASDRDVIKNRESFAIFTKSKNGGGYWSGDLAYMKPGEGYMLYRNDAEEVSFKYPYYEPGSTIFGSAVAEAKPAFFMEYPTTMSLAACVAGIDTEEGDQLVAMTDMGDICGTATLIDSVYYMSISSNAKAALTFAIEREGEIIATAPAAMQFEANTVSGNPSEPTQIDFTRCEPVKVNDAWFTIDGRKLNGRPTKTGVYIHNNEKVVIE